jgi:hypothetical protein
VAYLHDRVSTTPYPRPRYDESQTCWRASHVLAEKRGDQSQELTIDRLSPFLFSRGVAYLHDRVSTTPYPRPRYDVLDALDRRVSGLVYLWSMEEKVVDGLFWMKVGNLREFRPHLYSPDRDKPICMTAYPLLRTPGPDMMCWMRWIGVFRA